MHGIHLLQYTMFDRRPIFAHKTVTASPLDAGGVAFLAARTNHFSVDDGKTRGSLRTQARCRRAERTKIGKGKRPL